MTAEADTIWRMAEKDWTDIVVAVTAVAALVVALLSFVVSLRALRLSEKQEQRRSPRLVPKLLDSHFQNLPEGDRVYSFSLSVGNPTDSDNAIAQIEMHLRYQIDGSASITVKLPPSFVTSNPTNDTRRRLTVPLRVAAHDTVSGWCDFLVKSVITSGHAIEGYQFVLIDSHQTETGIDALIVSEKRDAV